MTDRSLSFFQPPVPGAGPRVKICGLTRGEEAARVAELGADAVGINFWPGSKRHVALDRARPWLAELAGSVTRVGLFVNAGEGEVEAALESGAIDAAQLHGDEPPERVAALLARGLRVFKALGTKDRGSLDGAEAYPGGMILLDAWAPAAYGGTGETMDWALGREAVERWPRRQVVLAGGLDPDNVARAIIQVRPHGVDVASGVESGAPGRKDLVKVEAFLQAARTAGQG